ncbi:MAG: desulfoferrodoxin [Candidatus Methanoplasma sp.]|jgi:superoxide reductase|nr:desulfoferrodoxin [Candidatus Methanoplasma sp.]
MGKIERRIYQCPECKNIIEVSYPNGGPAPSCCGNELEAIAPRTADASSEKHVPYIEKAAGGVIVKVGKDAAHPMTPEHYIVYIEICADGLLMRKYLRPGDKPEAYFKTDAKNISAWEFCNVHKYWTSSL